MNTTMQHLTHATACFPLVFTLFHGKYSRSGILRDGRSGILHDVPRSSHKEVKSKHHGEVKEVCNIEVRSD